MRSFLLASLGLTVLGFAGAALLAGCDFGSDVPPEAHLSEQAVHAQEDAGRDPVMELRQEEDGGFALPTTQGTLLPCEAYCTAAMTNCAKEKLYPTLATCLAACQDMPPGTPGDATGDSLACRVHHAQDAEDAGGGVTTECAAAGPLGNGVCGDRCVTFCRMATHGCRTVANPAFASEEECLASCGPGRDFAFDPDAPELDAVGSLNTLNCRNGLVVEAYLDGLASNAERVCPVLGALSHAKSVCVY